MLPFFFQFYLFIAGPVWKLSAIKCATVAVGWKWEWISSTSQLGTRRCIRWNVILTPETITHLVISDCFLICFVICKSCMWTLILSNYCSVSVKLFIRIECGSKKENTWKNMKIAFISLNFFFDLPLVSLPSFIWKLIYFIFYFWYTQKICSYYTKHICPEGKFSLKEFNKVLILLLSTVLLCSTLDKGKSLNKAKSYGPWTLLVLRLC